LVNGSEEVFQVCFEKLFNSVYIQLAIEKIVSETEHKFCVGDHLTIADICLIPQAYVAQTRADIDLKKEFPRIYWLYESGVTMRCFSETHPEKYEELNEKK
jgi:glutathione S-transferase